VLPVDFRAAVAAGENPSGVGVPTNAGSLIAHGVDLWIQNGGLTLKADTIRGSLRAHRNSRTTDSTPRPWRGHLFPLGYVPDLTATLSYEFAFLHRRLRITPSISYESGYPYGNGTMVYQFDRSPANRSRSRTTISSTRVTIIIS